MASHKSYRQFCALARSLDHVGDRWTLLIVRELLLGPARYGELLHKLPGLATNLLAERLRQLEADGLLEHRRAPDVAHEPAAYHLTERGAALEPVVVALILWGAPLMTTGPGRDHTDERWALLALNAMLTTPRVDAPEGELIVHCGDRKMLITIDSSGRRVTSETGAATQPLATITAGLPDLLAAVSSGTLGPGIAVDGNRQFAANALRQIAATPAGASTLNRDEHLPFKVPK